MQVLAGSEATGIARGQEKYITGISPVITLKVSVDSDNVYSDNVYSWQLWRRKDVLEVL